MIKNGKCDSACYNSQCGWDGFDCGCAANCAYSELGTCKSDCLVPGCNYDQLSPYPSCADPKLSLAAFNYHLLVRNFTWIYDFPTLCTSASLCSATNWLTSQSACSTRCNNLGCVYAQGNCVASALGCKVPPNCAKCELSLVPGVCLSCLPGYFKFYTKCVSVCPTGFFLHTIVPNLCYPQADISTPASPFPIFVQSTPNPQGNGTYSNPLDNLADALDAVWMQYSVVYLLAGIHNLTNCTLAPYLLSFTQAPTSSSLPVQLTISGYLCTMDASHSLCAKSPPTLSLDNTNPVTFLVRSNITIQHLTFWGGTTLVPGCTQDFCTYCPATTLGSGGSIDDRGNMLTAGKFAPSVLCVPFLSQRFVDLDTNANLTLWDVSFTGFMQGFRSLLYFTVGNLNLTSVNFTNITIGMYSKPTYSTILPLLMDSVIVQENPSTQSFINSSLALNQVTVFLLNNGYEYNVNLSLGGFLSVQGLRNVMITNTKFSYTLCFRSSLLTVGNFLSFSLLNCTFNRVYAGMFVLKLTPTIYPKVLQEVAMEHIVIRNVSFSQCAAALPGTTTSGQLVNIYTLGSLLNMQLSSILLMDIFVQGYAVYIRGVQTPADMTGTVVLTKPAGVLVSTAMPPKWLLISGMTLQRCITNTNLLYLLSMVNVNINALNVTNSGDSLSQENINTKAFAYFAPVAYLSKPATIPAYLACTSPITLRSLYNVTLVNFVLADCTCLAALGTGGVQVSGTPIGDLTVLDGKIERLNSKSTSFAVCLHLFTTGNVVMRRVTINGNYATKAGCVQLSAAVGYAVALDSVSFLNGAGVSAQLQILSSQNATLSNCTFTGTASSQEAGLLFQPLGGLTSSLFYISTSTFSLNKGLSGVCVYLVGDLVAPTPVSLQLDMCQFMKNQGSGAGTAVMVDSANVLAADSYIRNTVFKDNVVNEAAIFISPQVGQLDMRNVTCSGSSLDNSTASASLSSVGCLLCTFSGTSSSVPILTLSNSDFSFNSGISMISFNSASGLATLITSNNSFTGNLGRAIYLQQAILIDSNSFIQDNERVGYYLAASSQATITAALFRGNKGQVAGALYLGGGSKGTCINCVFEENQARSGTGAVYAEQSSELHLINGVFRRNSASKQGAAVTLFGSDVNNTIDQTVFEDNINGMGGTVLLLSSSLTMRGVNFSRNKGEFAPGLLAYFATVNITSVQCADQTSRSGSCIYSAINSSIYLATSTFTNVWADEEGGAIYLLSASLICRQSSFFNVSAARGALLFASSSANFTLVDISAVQTSARSHQGGAIYTAESYGYLQSVLLQDFLNNGLVGTNQKVLYLENVFMQRKDYAEGYGLQGAGVFCSDCLQIEAKNCLFANLSANVGAGVYLSAPLSDPQTYHFRNCTFASLVGNTSGAVQLESVNADFRSCTFLSNVATRGSGGAINQQCTDESGQCSTFIATSTFRNNSAAVQGGGISWQVSKPELVGNTFEGGQAKYGADVASFNLYIKVKSISGNATLEYMGADEDHVSVEGTLWNAGSGQIQDTTLTIAILDHYDQVVTTENDDTASLVALDTNTATIGNISAIARNGIFKFIGFGLSAPPGSISKVYIVSAKLLGSKGSAANATERGKVGLKVEMRSCLLGESFSGKDCVPCATGKFNLEPSATCQECLPEAICYGNFTIVPRGGYWRTGPLSPTFYECPNKDACIGSPSPPEKLSLTGECADGYYGNLCNGCLSGYSRQNQNQCLPCPSIVVNIVRLAGISLGVLIALVVIIRTAINAARRSRSYYSIYIKIMLNYLQLVMLTSTFQMKWPGYMKQLFSIQNSAGNITEQIFAVDCFFSGSTESQANAVRMKLVGMALAPFAILCCSLVIWLPVALLCRHVNYLVNEMLATIVICFFLVHPSIVKFVFGFMYCRELDPGQFWQNDYLNIPCWDTTHYRYVFIVAVPSAIGWGVGMPMLCLLVLYRNRNRLGLTELKVRFGFVYNGYEYSKYYWEFVIMYRKLLIITIAVFLANISTSVQALTAMSVLLAAFGLQQKHQPFALEEMNGLELRAILVASVTIYCGLYYMTSDLDPGSQVLMFAIVVSVNAYFVGLWVFRIFHAGLILLQAKCPWLLRWIQAGNYKVQQVPLAAAKIGSSVSRSQGDSNIYESVDLSRVSSIQLYESSGDQLNISAIRGRLPPPDHFAPENSPGSSPLGTPADLPKDPDIEKSIP